MHRSANVHNNVHNEHRHIFILCQKFCPRFVLLFSLMFCKDSQKCVTIRLNEITFYWALMCLNSAITCQMKRKWACMTVHGKDFVVGIVNISISFKLEKILHRAEMQVSNSYACDKFQFAPLYLHRIYLCSWHLCLV